MDKKAELLELGTTSTTLENRLFFAARNLAIEAMMLRLETTLLRKGYAAECVWSESSFGKPALYIKLVLNPKADKDEQKHGCCTLWLNRDAIPGPQGLSRLYYSAADFYDSECWQGREPAKLVQFRAVVAEMHAQGHLTAEIDKLNYPFEYQFHSSF